MYKSKYLLFLSLSIVLVTLFQWGYFKRHSSLNVQSIAQKKSLVSLIGLPDLALVTEAHYVRHRSLSDAFSFFADSPELLEYFPSTFVYMYTPSIAKNPSRIVRDEH